MLVSIWALSIPVHFVFDCLAAGFAANGTWTCDRRQSIHRLTRSVHHWIAARHGTVPCYDHVQSHQGDPWNEAADAACWATMYQCMQGTNFEAMHDQELLPFARPFEWLWYWQKAVNGTTGFPCGRHGHLIFLLDSQLPPPDCQLHTLPRQQADFDPGTPVNA